MPPKKKAKPKAKPLQKQKQSQVVNIRIGDTKPKRRTRAKPKPKPRPDDKPDGWLPPQNLTRGGQIFPPYQPAPPPDWERRLMALERTGSAGTIGMPPPIVPTLAEMQTEPEPEPQPSYNEINKAIIDAERTLAGIPKSPFLRPSVNSTAGDWFDMFDESSEPPATPFVAPKSTSTPELAPITPPEPPAFPDTTEKKQSKRSLLQDVRSNIGDAFKELGITSQNKKKAEIKAALGPRFNPKLSATQYTSLNDAEAILAHLRFRLRESGVTQPEFITQQTGF